VSVFRLQFKDTVEEEFWQRQNRFIVIYLFFIYVSCPYV